jgi:dipeptidase D
MNSIFSGLEPQSLWEHFEQLNAVPRPSKKETKVREFIRNFGQTLGLEVSEDAVGNVLIRKAGHASKTGAPAVILQSHLDMVHQKNADSDFDFSSEGIDMLREGDWIRAKSTTLGADNGIGVAAAMAILSATDIPHPPIEALFTIDEETGMTGAKGLQPGFLKGSILLNLDTEDDDELTIGCAGGVDLIAEGQYQSLPPNPEHLSWSIHLRGLTGGHSGMDIHKGRANANKLMNRILFDLQTQFSEVRLSQLDGGGLRNAIPRESKAIISFPASTDLDAKLHRAIGHLESVLKAEYQTSDPNLEISVASLTTSESTLDPVFQDNFLHSIYSILNGIYRLSPDVEGLVQTSNNLARVTLKDGHFSVQCLSRSSVDSEKVDLSQSLASSLQPLGGSLRLEGSYPGWTPRPGSDIVKLMSGLYREMFSAEPKVRACHAGLECGIIGTHYPEMQMISFGPNIRGAHSPDERVQISSVEKFWAYLLKTLATLAN